MMNNYCTLDSSVLIPLFLKSDLHHEFSYKFFSFSSKIYLGFLIPKIVLFEVFHILSKKNFFANEVNMREFEAFFSDEDLDYFELDDKFFEDFKKCRLFRRLKTSDAIIAASAFLTESVLISWDKKLLEISRNGCTPKEFLERWEG